MFDDITTPVVDTLPPNCKVGLYPKHIMMSTKILQPLEVELIPPIAPPASYPMPVSYCVHHQI